MPDEVVREGGARHEKCAVADWPGILHLGNGRIPCQIPKPFGPLGAHDEERKRMRTPVWVVRSYTLAGSGRAGWRRYNTPTNCDGSWGGVTAWRCRLSRGRWLQRNRRSAPIAASCRTAHVVGSRRNGYPYIDFVMGVALIMATQARRPGTRCGVGRGSSLAEQVAGEDRGAESARRW